MRKRDKILIGTALLLPFGAGTAIGATSASTVTVKTVAGPTKTVTRYAGIKKVPVPGPTRYVTKWKTVYKAAKSASPATVQPTPADAAPPRSYCKVMQMGSAGLEFMVSGDPGTVSISFQGAESYQVFPGETVTTTSDTEWFSVPAADIGASAEPVTCTVS